MQRDPVPALTPAVSPEDDRAAPLAWASLRLDLVRRPALAALYRVCGVLIVVLGAAFWAALVLLALRAEVLVR